MTGSIHFREDTRWWFVIWYDKESKKNIRINWYKGERMYDRRIAQKLLANMQSDVDNNVFRLENYTNKGTAVIPYFKQWLATKKKKTPATYKGYNSYLRCHFEPFFNDNPGIMIHDIQLDTLDLLLDSLRPVKGKVNKDLKCPECSSELIKNEDEGIFICGKCDFEESQLSGKAKYNIMNCFHAFMDYAWRAKKIPEMPPFPKKEDYGIVEPAIKWLSENRQMAIIDAIPDEHRPIFLFLKFHFRRPSEACAIYKTDYDEINSIFTIRRTISARKLVNHTKTHKEHTVPCHSKFKPIAESLLREPGEFLFTNPSSKLKWNRYSNFVLNRLWDIACEKVGENIDLYSGLKHSSCSQFINEKDGNLSDLQVITDHARLESVKKYAKTQVARKRELMEREVRRTNVIDINEKVN